MVEQNQLHIVLVVPAFYPDSYGGAERQALILANSLSQHGARVSLLTPSVERSTLFYERASFGDIYRLHLDQYPNLGGRHALSLFRWSFWVQRVLSRLSKTPDAIYIFHARLHALGPLVAAKLGAIPALIKLGGGGDASDFAALRAKRYWYGHWAQSVVLKLTDMFVANSDEIVNDLKALGVADAQIARIPNGVQLPTTSNSKVIKSDVNGPKFIFLGRMVPDKRIDVIVFAALRLLDMGYKFSLMLVGEGPERKRLEAIVAGKQQKATIRFHEYVDDVYPFLADADFFVSASVREGQSNALLEAMSASVVPIVCSASGASDLVTDGSNGFIADDEEMATFAASMQRALMLDDRERGEIAENARKTVQNYAAIEAVAARTISLVLKLKGKQFAVQ